MNVRTKSINRETCGSSRADFRIPGIPHSTVEQVETNRKETDKRLVEQFEITQTGISCWKTSRSRRRSNISVKNQRIWFLRWAIPKFSSSTRRLRWDSVRIARCVVKFSSHTAHAENACSLRKSVDISTEQIWHVVDSWTRGIEEPIPSCWALSIIASNNVSQSTWYVVRKTKKCKAWSSPNYSWKVV